MKIEEEKSYILWLERFRHEISFCYFSDHSSTIVKESRGSSNKWLQLAAWNIRFERSINLSPLSYTRLTKLAGIDDKLVLAPLRAMTTLKEEIIKCRDATSDVVYLAELFLVIVKSELGVISDNPEAFEEDIQQVLDHLAKINYKIFPSFCVRLANVVTNREITSRVSSTFSAYEANIKDGLWLELYHLRNSEDSSASLKVLNDITARELDLVGDRLLNYYIEYFRAYFLIDSDNLKEGILKLLDLRSELLESEVHSSSALGEVELYSLVLSSLFHSLLIYNQSSESTLEYDFNDFLSEYHEFRYRYPFLFTYRVGKELGSAYESIVQNNIDKAFQILKDVWLSSISHSYYFGLIQVFRGLTRACLLRAKSTSDVKLMNSSINMSLAYSYSANDLDLVNDVIDGFITIDKIPETLVPFEDGHLNQFQRVTRLSYIEKLIGKLSDSEVVKYSKIIERELSGPFSMSPSYDVARAAVRASGVALFELILIDSEESIQEVNSIFVSYERIIGNKNTRGYDLILHELGRGISRLFSKVTFEVLNESWVIRLLEMMPMLSMDKTRISGSTWIEFARPGVALYRVLKNQETKIRIQKLIGNVVPKDVAVKSAGEIRAGSSLLTNPDDILALLYRAQIDLSFDLESLNKAIYNMISYFDSFLNDDQSVGLIYPLQIQIYFSLIDHSDRKVRREFIRKTWEVFRSSKTGIESKMEIARSFSGWISRSEEELVTEALSCIPNCQEELFESLDAIQGMDTESVFPFSSVTREKVVAQSLILSLSFLRALGGSFDKFNEVICDFGREQDRDIQLALANIYGYMAFSKVLPCSFRREYYNVLLKNLLSPDLEVRKYSLRGCQAALDSENIGLDGIDDIRAFFLILRSFKENSYLMQAAKLLSSFSKTQGLHPKYSIEAKELTSELLKNNPTLRHYKAS